MWSWGPECTGSRQPPEPRKRGCRKTGCSTCEWGHLVRSRDGSGLSHGMTGMTGTPLPKKYPATRSWRRRIGARGSCRAKTCQTLPFGGWIGCMPPSQICDFHFVSPSSFPSKRPCKPGRWLACEPPQKAPKTYSERLAVSSLRMAYRKDNAPLDQVCDGSHSRQPCEFTSRLRSLIARQTRSLLHQKSTRREPKGQRIATC